jgi:hypothetical protein
VVDRTGRPAGILKTAFCPNRTVNTSSAHDRVDTETTVTITKHAKFESGNAPRRDRVSLLANITVEPRVAFEDKGGKAINLI